VYGFLSMDVPLIEKRVCAAMRWCVLKCA
jgi:hypothetical protein